jgi:dienelactone hydrolase
VMGFSRGGTATQVASFESIRSGLFGKDSNLMFAGHIEFYGGCAATGKTTGKPILMLSGGAEDYQPAANCQYVHDIMKAQGANIAIKIYPGAYHGFDVDFKVAYRPNVQTASKCVVIRDADTDMAYIKDSATPLTPVSDQEADKATCGPGKGAHSGRDEAAARQSRIDVATFVRTNLLN